MSAAPDDPGPPPSAPTPKRRSLGRRWADALWQWPLALLILFEEWGWETLQRWLAVVGGWPGFRHIERWIRRLSPPAALVLFGVPVLALLPLKLLALWLIAHGHAVLGLGVILAAKVAGTALVAHLYSLTQPTLMRMAWFARWHARWIAWKTPLLARVRASAPWRAMHALRARLRRVWAPVRHPMRRPPWRRWRDRVRALIRRRRH
jgi:hypothetical protein